MKKTKKFIVVVLITLPLFLALGCSAKNMKTTQLNNIYLQKLTYDNNLFAMDLFQTISKNHNNTFFSPLSISEALAMTYAGAKGKTKQQMKNVLHFNLEGIKLHKAFNILNEALKNISNKHSKMRLANALWGQKGYKFKKTFTTLIKTYYAGNFYTVDFIHQTKKARKTINNWIAQQTDNKIKNLLHKGDINFLTRLVLTNAIYFKGIWERKFDKSSTKNMPFYTSDKIVNVKMMHNEDYFPYYEDNKVQALILPYKSRNIFMLIILPKAKYGLWDVEKHLDLQYLNCIIKGVNSQKIKVYLPTFKLKEKYYLKEILSKMGMPIAFSKRANFSGMTGKKDLKIAKVIHEAFVDINETGTEATAATTVVMQLKAIMKPFNTPVFRANHPFMFLIMNQKTKAILFMGSLNKPKLDP